MKYGYKNYEEATEHFANGLNLTDNNYKLIITIYHTQKGAIKILRKIKEHI